MSTESGEYFPDNAEEEYEILQEIDNEKQS